MRMEEIKVKEYVRTIDGYIRKVIFVDEYRLVPGETAEKEDIKSIVTKEMMKSVEYKVGE